MCQTNNLKKKNIFAKPHSKYIHNTKYGAAEPVTETIKNLRNHQPLIIPCRLPICYEYRRLLFSPFLSSRCPSSPCNLFLYFLVKSAQFAPGTPFFARCYSFLCFQFWRRTRHRLLIKTNKNIGRKKKTHLCTCKRSLPVPMSICFDDIYPHLRLKTAAPFPIWRLKISVGKKAAQRSKKNSSCPSFPFTSLSSFHH